MSPTCGIDHASGEGSVVLSVIAPCLNEESNIAPLVGRILAVLDAMNIPAELVLVDDGSTDRTWSLIHTCGQDDERVRGVQHACNRGMVPAWRSGVEAAAGEFVCLIDADLQNRPEDIPRLYERYRAGSCDVVQAVRHPSRWLARTRFFSRGLHHLLNIAFRMRSRDNKSGFILCRRGVLSRVLQHRHRYRYFQNFLGAAIHARGYRIGEVDTIFDERRRGESFLTALPLPFCARVLWEMIKFRIETLGPAPAIQGRPLVPAIMAETPAGKP